MPKPCVYLGEFAGQVVTVRCRQIGGRRETDRAHYCGHPDREFKGRRGPRPGLCLPTWGGPWILPDQAIKAATIEVCAKCPLRLAPAP